MNVLSAAAAVAVQPAAAAVVVQEACTRSLDTPQRLQPKHMEICKTIGKLGEVLEISGIWGI